MKKVSVIIPVYNEIATIEDVIKKVLEQAIPTWEREIIAVDDGSTDGTKDVLKKWSKKIQVIMKDKNEGKGSALSEGFAKARGDVILIQDADLEYSPTDYPKLLEPFEHEQVEVVYGSRFLGAHLSTFFVYTMGNKFVTFMTNILYNTNITDMETGAKVFRKKVLHDIMPLTARRFDFEPEFTAKILKARYQIYEVPISYYGRKFEDGKKLTWKDGVVALWTLIKYKFVS